MLKTELRKEALKRRKSLSDEAFVRCNRQILAHFAQLDLGAVKSIHVFLPIIHQREPDTLLIIDYLEASHPAIEIVVSKSDFKTCLMCNFSYAGKADLKENPYKIPEPQTAQPFTGVLDMVLVPLLAFDKNGYRVGYGKGFYDRFLAGMHVQKVGISLFGTPVEINDVHLNDIRLDKCITPSGIVTFNNA